MRGRPEVTPSSIEVAFSAISIGVKPNRAAAMGSTWKLVAGPLMVLAIPSWYVDYAIRSCRWRWRHEGRAVASKASYRG